MIDIPEFNRNWLAAWSQKDVPKLAGFYTDDLVYLDANVPQGLRGKADFVNYLEELFANTPPMEYIPDEIWLVQGGYFGRWYCNIEEVEQSLRGFDVVTLRDNLISYNEVYIHALK